MSAKIKRRLGDKGMIISIVRGALHHTHRQTRPYSENRELSALGPVLSNGSI